MPTLKNAVPKYRKHKASGQALVTIAGTDHYLGKFGSKASKMLYDRLIGEWLATGRQAPPPDPDALSVMELVSRYWRYAKKHYRHPDGTPTETADVIKPALRMLKEFYGDLSADDFGPIALKRLQQHGIDQGHSRRYINDNMDRIRRVFRWGVSEELVDESTYRRLHAVVGLRKGKTEANEPPPVPPVDDSIVEQTIPQLPPIIADMVQVQRLTLVRPGELCIMRPCDIDRTGDVWIYTPVRHKTEHHGKDRSIAIGPRAQEILVRYLDCGPTEYCSSPQRRLRNTWRRVEPAELHRCHKGTSPSVVGASPKRASTIRTTATDERSIGPVIGPLHLPARWPCEKAKATPRG